MKRFLTIIAVLALGVPAFAQQDITALLDSTRLTATTTNTAARNGSGVFGWQANQVATVQASIVSTNSLTAGATNTITFTFDTSLNRTDWNTDAYSYTLVSSGTNPVSTIKYLTNTVGGIWMRFGTTKNPNTNYVDVSRFTWYVP